MKQLLLLRHAKSSWEEPGVEDFNRPLAPRGERDAPRIGVFLAETESMPDLIVSSPAERAKATTKRVAKAAEYAGDLRFDERIYMAGSSDLLEVVRGLPDNAQRVMLVGHNPGFEDLATLLSGGFVRLTTAALACIELGAERWQDVQASSGALVWLVTPKTLP